MPGLIYINDFSIFISCSGVARGQGGQLPPIIKGFVSDKKHESGKKSAPQVGGLTINQEKQLILHENVIRDVWSIIETPIRTNSQARSEGGVRASHQPWKNWSRNSNVTKKNVKFWEVKHEEKEVANFGRRN